jgi:hypothetical protein
LATLDRTTSNLSLNGDAGFYEISNGVNTGWHIGLSFSSRFDFLSFYTARR